MKTKIIAAFKRLLAPLGFVLGEITYESEVTTRPNGSLIERFMGYKVLIYLKTYMIKARSVFIFKEEEIDKKLMDAATDESQDDAAIKHARQSKIQKFLRSLK